MRQIRSRSPMSRQHIRRIFDFSVVPEGTPVFIVTLWDDVTDIRVRRRRLYPFNHYDVINAFFSEQEMNIFLREVRDRYSIERNNENKYDENIVESDYIFDGWSFIWGPVNQELDEEDSFQWIWNRNSGKWNHVDNRSDFISPDDVLRFLRHNYNI